MMMMSSHSRCLSALFPELTQTCNSNSPAVGSLQKLTYAPPQAHHPISMFTFHVFFSVLASRDSTFTIFAFFHLHRQNFKSIPPVQIKLTRGPTTRQVVSKRCIDDLIRVEVKSLFLVLPFYLHVIVGFTNQSTLRSSCSHDFTKFPFECESDFWKSVLDKKKTRLLENQVKPTFS